MTTHGLTVRDFRTEVPGKLSPTCMSWEFPPIIAEKRGSDKKVEWRLIVRLVRDRPSEKGEPIFVKIKDEFFDSQPIPDNIYGWIKVFKKHSDAETWDKTTPTLVKSGKNIGRKNQTNIFTQALRDAYGLYNTQIERATVVKRGHEWEAERYPPMLVQLLGNQKVDFSNIYVQRKLDGVRTVATLEKSSGNKDAPDTVLLYSRNKKTFEGKQYLRDKLLPVLQYYRDNRNMCIYLDGEVYAHNESLQTISGEMRQTKEKENPNIRLQYYVFDVFIPAQPKLTYEERKKILDELFEQFGDKLAPEVIQVETFHATSRDEVDRLFESFLDDSYEGAILRLPDKHYVYSHKGYHSANILKMKPTHDDDFEIVGYHGAEGKGKAKGLLMWRVKTDDGSEFDVTPMGTHEDRADMFKRLSKRESNGKTVFENHWKGKMLTVIFDDLSDDNIPLRARAKALRTYE